MFSASLKGVVTFVYILLFALIYYYFVESNLKIANVRYVLPHLFSGIKKLFLKSYLSPVVINRSTKRGPAIRDFEVVTVV